MALTGLTKIQKIGINTATIPTLGGSENTGVVTATNFIGDGSGLTGVTGSGSGVIVRDGGSLVGTAGTINFGTNLNVSAISAGIVTVTNAASSTSLTGLSDVTVTSASNGQILKHNGSVFVNTAERTYSQSSVASGSNVNLRLSDGSTDDDILITAGSNINFSSVSANGFTIAAAGGGGGGGISNVIDDTSPELGGNLNLNNKYITGSGGANISGVVTATSFTGNGANITDVNATTLDSIDSGSFLRSDATDTCSGQMNFTNQLITKNDGDFNTQGGVALVIGHTTNSAMRANHFIHDDHPSGSGTYFIQATESGVSNDRNMCLQGYGGKIKVGSTNAPTEVLDVNGNVKATSFIGSGVALTGVVTSIVAGSNITLTGGPTGIVTISASGGGGGGISLSGGVDNRVVTASSASAVQGEANLTFDGTTLGLTGNQTVSGSVVVGTAVTINSDGINGTSGVGITAHTLKANNDLTVGGSIYGSSRLMFSGGSGSDLSYFAGGTAYSNHIFKLMQGGSTIERFRVSVDGGSLVGVMTATSFSGLNGTGIVVSGVSTFHNNIVATATTALSVTVADESADASCNVLFATAATGNVAPKTGDNLTFASNTGVLSASAFAKIGGTSSQYLKADGSVSTGIELSDDSSPQLGGDLDLNSNDITGTGEVRIVGLVTATSAVKTWTLGASASSHYTFTGDGFTSATNDPDIYLERGKRYAFLNNSGGNHPFQIRVSNGGSAYTTGVTYHTEHQSGSNSASQGYITFNVPWDAPSYLYYQCTAHSGMGGNIYIRGGDGYREIRNYHLGPWAFVNDTAKTTITVGDPGDNKFTTIKLILTLIDGSYRQGMWQGEYTIFASNSVGGPGVNYYLKEHWQQVGSSNWSGGTVSVAITSGGALQVTADNGHDDAAGNAYIHILDVIGDIDGSTVASISS